MRTSTGQLCRGVAPPHPRYTEYPDRSRTNRIKRRRGWGAEGAAALPSAGGSGYNTECVQVPEEQHEGPKETPEVVVPVDVTLFI